MEGQPPVTLLTTFSTAERPSSTALSREVGRLEGQLSTFVLGGVRRAASGVHGVAGRRVSAGLSPPCRGENACMIIDFSCCLHERFRFVVNALLFSLY